MSKSDAADEGPGASNAPDAAGVVFSSEFLGSLDATIRLLQAWREEVRLRTPLVSPICAGEILSANTAEFLDFFLVRLAGMVDWYLPSCAKAQCAPPSPEALAGQMIVGMLAPNLMRCDYAASFGSVDKELTDLLSTLLRVPETAGLSMYSGTAAIHTALMAARREAQSRGERVEDLVVLTGSRAHSSIEKLCSYAGLRDGAVLRLDPATSEKVDHAIAALGDSSHVAALVGTAGDTDTGAIDDFEIWQNAALRLRGNGHTARLVCDCVLSWPLLALSETDLEQARLTPAERESILSFLEDLAVLRSSDFLAIDFHKWARTPLGAAHLLLRRELVTHLAPTTILDPLQSLEQSPHELVIDTTRSASGAVGAMLNLGLDHGAAMRRAALRGLLLARRSAQAVHEAGWQAIPGEPHGPIVCLTPKSRRPHAKQRCLDAAANIARLGGPVGTVRWLSSESAWVVRLCFVHPDAPLDAPQLVAAGLQSISK